VSSLLLSSNISLPIPCIDERQKINRQSSKGQSQYKIISAEAGFVIQAGMRDHQA
jgi:hypothetical protein